MITPPDSETGWVAHGDFVYRHKSVPTFTRAEGSFIHDSHGRSYLDAEAANGTASLGFDTDLLTTAGKTIANLPGLPSFCESVLRKDLAQRLGEDLYRATGHKGRIAFELGGAQGVELALKVVASNTSRSQIVVFEGGYHGRSGLTSQLSASHRYRSVLGNWRIPVVRLPYPDAEQGRLGERPEDSTTAAVRYVEQLVSMEFAGLARASGEQDVATVIIEPVLNAGGIVKPSDGYMKEVVRIFRQLGALIVVDEIFTGFHRAGPMWGFELYEEIDPDIVVMSKALTNGIVPLSAVWAREPLMAPGHFKPGTHSATYQCTPFALAVAHAVLDRYESWSSIHEDLNHLQRRLGDMVGRVSSVSSLATSGWASGGLARVRLNGNHAHHIVEAARNIRMSAGGLSADGLLLASTGMAPHVIAVNPPLTISNSELDLLDAMLMESFKAAEGNVT